MGAKNHTEVLKGVPVTGLPHKNHESVSKNTKYHIKMPY